MRARKFSMLACLLLVFTGCCLVGRQRLKSGDVSESRGVSCPFELGGWRLLLGTEGTIGDPVEAFTHLYAEKGGSFLRIDDPTDLNRVSGIRVRTPSEALALVRLFTSMDTYHYFRRPCAIEYPPDSAVVQ